MIHTDQSITQQAWVYKFQCAQKLFRIIGILVLVCDLLATQLVQAELSKNNTPFLTGRGRPNQSVVLVLDQLELVRTNQKDDTQRYTIHALNLKLFSNHVSFEAGNVFIEGISANLNDRLKLTLKNTTISLCPHLDLSLNLFATQLQMNDEVIQLEGIFARIGTVPIIYLPSWEIQSHRE